MKLSSFFEINNKVAIAFSGGVDSSYLLYTAVKSGADVRAYYVKSAFQPQFELEDALRFADEIGADIKVLEADVLSEPKVIQNPVDRCYYCKHVIFTMIKNAALEDGFPLLCDGTNASDDEKDRPGMRALKELSVRSPLRECGLTKEDIRSLSKEAGLSIWNKPAYACLATRIPVGEEITSEKLQKTETAENYLFSLGFTDFRVRMMGDTAKIQVPVKQIEKVLENREKIITELKMHYSSVLLDLEGR